MSVDTRKIHNESHTFRTYVKSGKGTLSYCEECLKLIFGSTEHIENCDICGVKE